LKNYIDIIKKVILCPDCKSSLNEFVCGELLGFYCLECLLFFPIIDDVPIILPKEKRNYKLEYNILNEAKKIINEIYGTDNLYMNTINNTMKYLVPMGDKTWEWEDEEFWSNHYSQESKTDKKKNWNDRIWQRDILINKLVEKTTLNNKIIVDVGCGEGQNFRTLLSKYCDKSTLYIATDISFEGLKLNRERNLHQNSLYILCTADNLPFMKESIDILLYFGILHHTFKKSSLLIQDAVFIKADGFILIHEAIERPYFSSLLPIYLKSDIKESTHEERIIKEDLIAVVHSLSDFKIMFSKEMHTIFFGLMKKLLRSYFARNKNIFYLILTADRLFLKTLGPFCGFFRAGELMILLKRY